MDATPPVVVGTIRIHEPGSRIEVLGLDAAKQKLSQPCIVVKSSNYEGWFAFYRWKEGRDPSETEQLIARRPSTRFYEVVTD